MKKQYDDVKFFLDQFVTILDSNFIRTPNGKIAYKADGTYTDVERQRIESSYRTAFSMIDKYPLLRQVKTNLKNEGYTDEAVIRHINDNLDSITNARINKMKDGEFVHIGRPKKAEEEKYRTPRNRSVDKYKYIKDIRGEGAVPVKVLRNIDYNTISNLTLKEAQKIAYWMQKKIKSDIRELHKAGFENARSERYFNRYGGFLKDIRKAKLNSLRAFIRRGSAFLRRETSTVEGMKNVMGRVSKNIREGSQGKVDIDRFTSDSRMYRLFMNIAHEIVDLGYGSLISDKYSVFGMVEHYLQGGDLDNETLMSKLNDFTIERLGEIGVHIGSHEELQKYLKNKYETRYEDLYS